MRKGLNRAARRNAARQRRSKLTTQSQDAPAKPSERVHRRLWPVAKLIVGFCVAGIGTIGSVYGLVGPPWPTNPIFAPVFPSAGFALDVPFVISNKSALFALQNMQIFCGIEDVELSPPSALRGFRGLSVTTGGKSTLDALASASYTCPFSTLFKLPPGTALTAGSIQFWTEYDSRWPWGGRVRSIDESFTLNTKTSPPQWTPGKPLK